MHPTFFMFNGFDIVFGSQETIIHGGITIMCLEKTFSNIFGSNCTFFRIAYVIWKYPRKINQFFTKLRLKYLLEISTSESCQIIACTFSDTPKFLNNI